METVRNFEVIPNKFNVVRICAIAKYAQNGSLIAQFGLPLYIIGTPHHTH
jgi:hypothetical protein